MGVGWVLGGKRKGSEREQTSDMLTAPDRHDPRPGHRSKLLCCLRSLFLEKVCRSLGTLGPSSRNPHSGGTNVHHRRYFASLLGLGSVSVSPFPRRYALSLRNTSLEGSIFSLRCPSMVWNCHRVIRLDSSKQGLQIEMNLFFCTSR